MSRRHHVVSRGYQRFFAEGERIALIEKATLTERLVGTRDAFVERGFNAYRVADAAHDELEDEWARLEAPALAAIREGLRSDDLPSAEVSIKVLMSMHIARSYFTRRLHDEYLAEALVAPTEGMDQEALIRAYESDVGSTPSIETLNALVGEFIEQRFRSNVLFVERMADMHNTILEKWLAPLHLQIGRTASVRQGGAEFVIGDSPVVRTGRAGLQVNAPLGDADVVMMPLSPHVIASLTTHPRDHVVLNWAGAQQINSLMWRSCQRWIACRPGSNWRLSLALHV